MEKVVEKVFCVPSEKVTALVPMGLSNIGERALLNFTTKEGAYYDRTNGPDGLEENTALKQMVAYVVVEYDGKILLYQRAPKNGDARLRKKFSIGFGGHINSDDIKDGQHPIIVGRNREVTEEITLGTPPTFGFIGTLNIAKSPIDQFHLGVVYKATISSPDYTIKEKESFAYSGWVTPTELAKRYDELENWSQEVFESMYPQLVTKATPSI